MIQCALCLEMVQGPAPCDGCTFVVCCLLSAPAHSPAQAPNFAEFPFERLCLECSSSGGGHSYVVARVSAISSAPPTSNRHQHQPSTATGDSSQDPDQRHVSCVMQICRGRVTCCSSASRVIYDPAVCCSQAAVAPQPSRDATRAAAPLQHCSRQRREH